MYTENTSDAWHIPQYPTRKHCITSMYHDESILQLTLSVPANFISVCKFSLHYPYKISCLVMRIKQMIMHTTLSIKEKRTQYRNSSNLACLQGNCRLVDWNSLRNVLQSCTCRGIINLSYRYGILGAEMVLNCDINKYSFTIFCFRLVCTRSRPTLVHIVMNLMGPHLCMRDGVKGLS